MPHFTDDWFATHIPLWERHLMHLAGHPIRCIEIGSYQGRSALWTAEHLCTHPEARLWCLDAWQGTEPMHREGAEALFDRNVAESPHGGRIIKIKGRSEDSLRFLARRSYDFVYIDGSHEARDVMSDWCGAWPCVRPGGIVIFDDYEWREFPQFEYPKSAIDWILHAWAPCIDVLHKQQQVIVKKR